jgi:hypothetical protein
MVDTPYKRNGVCGILLSGECLSCGRSTLIRDGILVDPLQSPKPLDGIDLIEVL